MARSAKSSKKIVRSYEYILGYETCHRSISRNHNPYAVGSTEWEEWRQGWNKRFWQEEMYSEP